MTTPIDTGRLRRLLTSLAALPVVGRHLVEGQLLDAMPGLLGEHDQLRAEVARLRGLHALRHSCVACGCSLHEDDCAPYCEDSCSPTDEQEYEWRKAIREKT